MDDDVTRTFSSLSIKDLLDAREAYHVHLLHLKTVHATAIGRYLIRKEDPNSKDPKHQSDAESLGPRTLTNSVLTEWSWPCVLVFVKEWIDRSKVGKRTPELVPSRLYLPDGRVVPTCVVYVTPSTVAPPAIDPPLFKSDLIGGGYPVQAKVQGKVHRGAVGCLVTDGDATYALSNRHVVGESGREIFAGFKNTSRRLGISSSSQIGKRPFAEVYPGWPGEHVVVNLDAGLIRIDNVNGWTAQAYGIGQMGDVVDLNVDTFRLDLINSNVIAFGSASGLMQGRILGLFYRYKTVGGVEYVTDFVIAPRGDGVSLNNYPGDSGTVWFVDNPDAERNGNGARILQPIALEWGGQEILASAGRNSVQLALGICLSTLCRELDVELIADWNAGHTEYWGEWGHTKIGAYATTMVSEPQFPNLFASMTNNADNIGLDDKLLQNMASYKRGDFAPLADVADLIWRFGRPEDESNHFADMDKPGKGGKTLLDLCADSMNNVDPKVWNDYYDGIGEDRRGALPFRVWQIFDEMVDFLKSGDTTKFICAAGIVAHYVGDACQPLHISQYHHGRDLSDKVHAKVHSIYETAMVTRFGPELIKLIPEAAIDAVAEIKSGGKPTGRDAAIAVVQLMQRTVERLPPLTIVDLFDDNMGTGQIPTLWAKLKEPTAACMQDGARTMARIWEAAWRAGGGEAIGKINACEQSALADLYHQHAFLQSYELQNVHLDPNDRIVGVAAAAAGHRKAPAAAHAPKPARAAGKSKTPTKRAPAKKTAAKKRRRRGSSR